MSAFNRLALFDCDGTLVDSQHAIIAAMAAGFASQGLTPPTDEAVRRQVGLSLEVAVLGLLPEGVGAGAVAGIVAAYKDAFFENRANGIAQEPLYPGLVAALDALETAGFLLGIATGKSHRGLVATLNHHGLGGRFITLQTADRAQGKPSPDMALKAMAEAGADPTTTVVIGDTSYDMQMARNAGAAALGVAWGYHAPQSLLAAGAARVCHDYAEVPAAVAALVAA
ncbi:MULTISPECIES: HAD-IA family hydrolase [Nitrospirillum]|uniref:Phosphoglycolate phosphatase n=1 Tax=Nitrospirillum amazonense TaxID=28077 RepID=A0A560G4R9_9PROT|nr:HAD-IA family hydrolase [Nitrospirillum amazonense]MEC4594000.1 HAD-IA family hydrolase [Nitrospirillum amazonense]TWB28879.1 phosphoglycolate phosphatase [Nitrospirillum amazonense]